MQLVALLLIVILIGLASPCNVAAKIKHSTQHCCT